MPFQHEYTKDGGVISTASGHLTGKEIIEMTKEFFAQPQFKDVTYWLVDRSHCEKYEVSNK